MTTRKDQDTTPRRVQLGAVQVKCDIGNRRGNLERMLPLIENAATRGAEIIVLPEMAASGYTITKDLWAFAEPVDGPTARWLRSTSKRLGVYLGIGLAEAEGRHFYNSYILADPAGSIVGRVRKRHAELRYVRSGQGPLAVDTPLGRIGIGICADTHYTDVVDHLMSESIDLVLMPHAWLTPYRAGGLVTAESLEGQNRKARDHAAFYSGILGVPAVFANQIGSQDTGFFSRLTPPELYDYPGYATITDSDAVVKASLGRGEEGVIVADVTLDPARKRFERPRSYEGLLTPRTAIYGKIKWPLSFYNIPRRLEYTVSLERRARAKEAAGSAVKIS